MSDSRAATVYTETVVFSPPERYADEAPYQLAIVDLESGERLTVRIVAEDSGRRVQIGERVRFIKERDGVHFYGRAHS